MSSTANPIELQRITGGGESAASPARRIRLLGVATIAVFVLGVLSVVIGAAEPPLETRIASAAEIQTLSSSASTLAQAPGYQYRVEIKINNNNTLDMEGRYAGNAGEFHLELPGIGPITYAFDQNAIYLPVRSGGWIAFTSPELDNPAAAAAVTGEDPLAALAAIANAPVEHAGRDLVDGVATTRYRAEISYRAALDASPFDTSQLDDPEFSALLVNADPVKFDAWVDDVGLLRKLRTKVKIGGFAATTTVHATPLDVAPTLSVPPSPVVQTRNFETLDALVQAATSHFARL